MKNPHKRQLGGTLWFCFTNAYLAMKYLGKNKKPHYQFKTTDSTALRSLNLQTCIKPGNRIYHLSQLFIHSRNCLILKIVFAANMDLRRPKRRETQPLSNVLLAMSQSANQQKAYVGTFT